MKGKTRFSAATAERIRILLGRVRSSPRPAQKVLRQQIRDLGFYISDFRRPASGFTREDFDALVQNGGIEVF